MHIGRGMSGNESGAQLYMCVQTMVRALTVFLRVERSHHES